MNGAVSGLFLDTWTPTSVLARHEHYAYSVTSGPTTPRCAPCMAFDRENERAALGGALGTRGVVLVADDDDDIRMAIADTLEFHGYRIVEARNGGQALRMALELKPQVILLDHCMPVMAGATVLSQLAQSGQASALVLMSAMGDLGSLARSVGARHVLSKPFAAEQLLGLVGALMDAAAHDSQVTLAEPGAGLQSLRRRRGMVPRFLRRRCTEAPPGM